jgi:hypothetical protein
MIQTLQLKTYFVKDKKNSNKFSLGLNEVYPSSRNLQFSWKKVLLKTLVFFLSFLLAIIAFLEPYPPDPI